MGWMPELFTTWAFEKRVFLEIIQKKLRYPCHQNALRGQIADSVAAAGKRKYFHIFSIFDQFVNQRERIREMHVVIAGTVSDQQFSLSCFAFSMGDDSW